MGCYIIFAQSITFLSTLSLRRATYPGRHPNAGGIISIHALLAESDPHCYKQTAYFFYFYPRSPCGERRLTAQAAAGHRKFLSTLSLRRATLNNPRNKIDKKLFLSTLSLRRATEYWVGGYGTANNFYPRSPCGERPYGRINDISRLIFLSTLSLRRATIGAITYVVMTPDFYPRSPCGERQIFI